MDLQLIQNKIYEIRGCKVMLDFDLAEMYEIETKYLKRSVRANSKRFPSDFMFELSKKEFEVLRCNFSTSNKRGGSRYLPFAFTEQGVAMLSAVLNSEKAIDINIAIMRAFVMIRQYALTYKELSVRLKEIEGKFTDVYEAINYLLNKDKLQTEQNQRKQIGYKTDNDQ
ncbi:MAG: ORF6N domain-containing protein [Bacteroidota bacterium]